MWQQWEVVCRQSKKYLAFRSFGFLCYLHFISSKNKGTKMGCEQGICHGIFHFHGFWLRYGSLWRLHYVITISLGSKCKKVESRSKAVTVPM